MTFRGEHDAQLERIALLERKLAEACDRERAHADTVVQLEYVRARLARAEQDRDASLVTPTKRRARTAFALYIVLLSITGLLFVRSSLMRIAELLERRDEWHTAQCGGASTSEP